MPDVTRSDAFSAESVADLVARLRHQYATGRGGLSKKESADTLEAQQREIERLSPNAPDPELPDAPLSIALPPAQWLAVSHYAEEHFNDCIPGIPDPDVKRGFDAIARATIEHYATLTAIAKARRETV